MYGGKNEPYDGPRNLSHNYIVGLSKQISTYKKFSLVSTEIASYEEMLKTAEEELLNFKEIFYQDNLKSKQDLENRVSKLIVLKSIVTNDNNQAYIVTEPQDFRITVNVPGFTEAHMRGAHYNDFYNEGYGHNIIVF